MSTAPFLRFRVQPFAKGRWFEFECDSQEDADKLMASVLRVAPGSLIQREPANTSPRGCSRCGLPGHYAATCKNYYGAQGCSLCGADSPHTTSKCPYRKRGPVTPPETP